MHEMIWRAKRWLLRSARTTLGVVLEWVGLGLLVASGALLVYLGAILMTRLAMWPYPP